MKRFLLLIFTSIFAFSLVACDDGGTTDNADDTTEEDVTEETEETEESEGTYSVGDTVEFEDAKFTLKAVNTTDERNEFADTDPTAVIEIEYELENLSDSELSYGIDITVYDAEGNQMESYPLDNSMGAIAPGKKVQGVEYHGVDALGTIEIHYAPIISFEDAAVFEVDVE